MLVNGTFGVAYAIDVVHGDAGPCKRVSNYLEDPLAMMLGRISWKKALAWWGDIRMPDVGQNGRGSVLSVLDNSST